MASSAPTSELRGAYGLRFEGLERVQELLRHPPSNWPTVSVEQHREPHASGAEALDGERATLDLPKGRGLVVEHAARRAVFSGEPLELDEIAHPYLGPIGTLFARWDGGEAFHAGAATFDGRSAVGLVGGKEAGKSTLLAALASSGVTVLADDLLVTDGERAFAGPRCIDLRPPPIGAPVAALRPVREAERLRLDLAPAPATLPLAGWLFLEWHSGPPRLSTIPASELLVRLIRWRAWGQLPSDPTILLRLGALPAWRLRRPRIATVLDETVALLTGELRAAA